MNKVSADEDLPAREHDNNKLMKYIQNVKDLDCSYVIKVGDYIMYGERSVEECHRLGEVTAEEVVDGVEYLHVKFQTVGAKRFVFDLAPVRIHKVLAVPLDDYKLHGGKRFHYFGPPPRCYSSHHLYIATKCIMMSDFPSPEATMEIYIGDVFCFKKQAGDGSCDLWCLVLGFLRHESITHEWTVLCCADISLENIQNQDVSALKWENHLFGILTPKLAAMLSPGSTNYQNCKLFNSNSTCYKKVTYFLHQVDDMLAKNAKSTILTMNRVAPRLGRQAKLVNKTESNVQQHPQVDDTSKLAVRVLYQSLLLILFLCNLL